MRFIRGGNEKVGVAVLDETLINCTAAEFALMETCIKTPDRTGPPAAWGTAGKEKCQSSFPMYNGAFDRLLAETGAALPGRVTMSIAFRG